MRAYFENFPHYKLVEHDWYSHEEFVDVVRLMDMGTQVSLTETFNIVAADFVAAGTPIVGSPQITWLPKMFQADPNSTESIKRKLHFAWSWTGQTMRYLSEMGLKDSSKAAEKVWLQYVKS